MKGASPMGGNKDNKKKPKKPGDKTDPKAKK